MARLQFLMFSLHSGLWQLVRIASLLCCRWGGIPPAKSYPACSSVCHRMSLTCHKACYKVCHKSQRSHFQDGLDKLCQSVAKVRWSDDHSDHSESNRVVQAGHLMVTLTTTCQYLLSFDLGRSLHSNSDMFRKHLWSFCQMWTSAWRTQALARVSAPCVGGKKVEVQLGSFGLSLLSTRSPRFVLECKTQVIHIHLAFKDEAAISEIIWIYLGYSRYSRHVLYRERAHEVCRECACWNVSSQHIEFAASTAAVWFRC